jgi:hypothetical protein
MNAFFAHQALRFLLICLQFDEGYVRGSMLENCSFINIDAVEAVLCAVA